MKETSGHRGKKRLTLAFSESLKIRGVRNIKNSSARNKTGVLFNQILDSFIVAGITGVSMYIYAGQDASWKAAGLSFLLTFLIRMKEYRKIAD